MTQPVTRSAQSALNAIPVKTIGAVGAEGLLPPTHYHLRRRLVQALSLALMVVIPVTGLFRFDPIAGGMVVLDRQIWFSDFFLVFGLWFCVATAMVFLYSIAGTVFCGWVCPQNSISEWANFLMRKLLGRRAEVSIDDGAPVRVTASKDRAVNWVILGIGYLVASMAVALLPMLYFWPPGSVWSFMTLHSDPSLKSSLYWIYGVFVLIILLDITILRHYWCRFACVYRVWQHSFKTRQTLHIAYDKTRAADCEGCNYCVTQCFIDLDPRRTDIYDSCINCGECIDACNRMHQKQELPGLLRFEFGERQGAPVAAAARPRRGRKESTAPSRSAEYSLMGRTRWAIPFTALGLAMFSWGLWTYQPYHLSVDHGAAFTAGQMAPTSYKIAVANKRYRPESVRIYVHGLPAQDYHLSATELDLGNVQHKAVTLTISRTLHHGLYPMQIEVRAQDGWVGRFSFEHFAG